MSVFHWYGYKVQVDEKATRAWYAQSEPWDCDCGHCRNFRAAADKLPKEMRAILSELGIPPEKTTDLSELFHEDGLLHYLANYRVAGLILERPEAEREEGAWGGLWCSDDARTFYPYGAVGFPEPCFDLSFCPSLPWVLDEPIEGPAEKP